VHFVSVATTLLKDEESARHNPPLFARNCARYSLIFEIFHWHTQQQTILNLVIDNPPHLKYVTTVVCNLSFTACLLALN